MIAGAAAGESEDIVKTILITGCSSGIGRTTAKYFQERGWQVAATMRTPENETELGTLPNVKVFKLDVMDEDSIKEAMAQAIDAFGAIDVVVNNAGYALWGAFETATAEQVRRQFDTNVLGLMNVTRDILPYFRSRRQGTIINLASIAGRITFPLGSLYHGTKYAVEGFSEAMSYELRQHNIKIKIIEPGIIKTDFYGRSMDKGAQAEGYQKSFDRMMKVMGLMEKMGSQPEVIAEAIYKAATDDSWRLRYSTGRGATLTLLGRRLLPERVLNALIRVGTLGF